MSAATKAALEALHKAHTELLTAIIKDGRTVVDKEGEVHTITPQAADLREIREFLKDNHIEALVVPGSPLGELAASLPFAGEPVPEDEPQNVSH